MRHDGWVIRGTDYEERIGFASQEPVKAEGLRGLALRVLVLDGQQRCVLVEAVV